MHSNGTFMMGTTEANLKVCSDWTQILATCLSTQIWPLKCLNRPCLFALNSCTDVCCELVSNSDFKTYQQPLVHSLFFQRLILFFFLVSLFSWIGTQDLGFFPHVGCAFASILACPRWICIHLRLCIDFISNRGVSKNVLCTQSEHTFRINVTLPLQNSSHLVTAETNFNLGQLRQSCAVIWK